MTPVHDQSGGWLLSLKAPQDDALNREEDLVFGLEFLARDNEKRHIVKRSEGGGSFSLLQSIDPHGQIIVFEASAKEDRGPLRQDTPVDGDILARRRELSSCTA